jgi:hypothetical protein
MTAKRKEKITLTDGAEYIGEVKNGKPHGRGIFTSPDGSVYEGNFKEDWSYVKGKTDKD